MYQRYHRVGPESRLSTSYVSHIAGSVAGLAVGLLLLLRKGHSPQQLMWWWLSLGATVASLLFALMHNLRH